MLKFLKHHITSIEGIEVYPVISLTLFTLFFVALLVWVFRTDKQKIKEISEYPLEVRGRSAEQEGERTERISLKTQNPPRLLNPQSSRSKNSTLETKNS